MVGGGGGGGGWTTFLSYSVKVKKYNEDKVNYANSKWRVFKVGIM